jgi:DUF4097 and DUF4098 domain-containing protein YvlB
MKTKSLFQLSLTTLACSVLAGCIFVDLDDDNDGWGSQSRKSVTEELEFQLESAGLEEIVAEGVNGSITVQSQDVAGVRIEARKTVHARSREKAAELAPQVEVKAVREGNRIRIYKLHDALPRGAGVSLSFKIACPKNVAVKLQSSNGSIKVIDIEGGIDARTSNATIELRGVSGRVHAATSNGTIRGEMERIEKDSHFSTSNGNIDLRFRSGSAPLSVSTSNGNIAFTHPSDFSGRIDASTSNGRVVCEAPVLVRMAGNESPRSNRLVGALGQGSEEPIRLRSSNGNITIRQTTLVSAHHSR